MADETGKKSAASAISGNKKPTLIITKNKTITSVGGGGGGGSGYNPVLKNVSTGNISKVGSAHRPPTGATGNPQNRPNNFYSAGKSRPTTPTAAPALQVTSSNGGHNHTQTPDIPGHAQHPPQSQGQGQGHHLGQGQGQSQGHVVSSSEEHESSSEVVSSSAGSRSRSRKKQGKGKLGEKTKNGNKKKKTASGNLRKKNSVSVHKTTNKLQRAMMLNAKKRQPKKGNGRQTGSKPVSSSDVESGATETQSLKRGQLREVLLDPEIDAKREMQCPRCLNEVKPVITGEPSKETHIISLALCILCCTPFMFMPYWFNWKATPVKRCRKCGAYLTEPPVRLNCEKTPPDSSDE